MRATIYSAAVATTISCLIASPAHLPAAETNAAPARVGIFDSRAVAYAWFASGPNQVQLSNQVREARAAMTSGDTNRAERLRVSLSQWQDEMHREVFSTASPDAALAALKDRRTEILKQANVETLVSKWDAVSLESYPKAERVDVTDRLVREFIQPTEEQSKTIAGVEKSEPLPLEQCNELIRKGQL